VRERAGAYGAGAECPEIGELERRADIYLAFLHVACLLLTLRRL
jgi:hypothetical protein